MKGAVSGWRAAGLMLLACVGVGCDRGVPAQSESQLAATENRRSDELEQIASALDASLEAAELGEWRVVEPVTFRHGVSAETDSPLVGTISFTCMFPITIEGTEHENLVRQHGRLVFHRDQWRLQQVGVSFKYFNENDFTDESDLLAASLLDGGKLTVLKSVWATTVRDTVELQLAARQLERAEAEQADEEAVALKKAEADAEAEAKRAKRDSLTEAARLKVMAARLTKIAQAANSSLGATIEGVDGLRLTGAVEVEVELSEDSFRGRVSFAAMPRDVTVEYISARFGRPWVYEGLEAGGGWDGPSRQVLSAFLDRRLSEPAADEE